MSLSHELQFAIEIAKTAGEIAIESFRKVDLSSSRKADKSWVTEADLAVNAFLIQKFEKEFPHDLIIGEEASGDLKKTSERIWWVDPIDGTSEYVRGEPEWAVQIGLALEGKAVLGVVYQPTEKILCYAEKNFGAYEYDLKSGETKRIFCRKLSDLANAILIDSRTRKDPLVEKILARFPHIQGFQSGSIGLKFAKIASGRADFYLNSQGKCSLWDTCGPEVLISEAGGIFETFPEVLQYDPNSNHRVTQSFFASALGISDELRKLLQ